jgi:hypothetical protein
VTENLILIGSKHIVSRVALRVSYALT